MFINGEYFDDELVRIEAARLKQRFVEQASSNGLEVRDCCSKHRS